MTISKLLQASALTSVLLIGSIAMAAESQSGSTEGTRTTHQQGATAKAAGTTSGPAAGTNVAPPQAPGAAGEPGRPGFPGNKNGPAVTPPSQQQGK